MSRDGATAQQANIAVTSESQNNPENSGIVTEDSNNNIAVGDGSGQEDNPPAAENGRSSQLSPAVREIHKNSWLKRLPGVDRWSGRFPKSQKSEKFWVVFCVHDDKEAFLEFYENRRSAYSHMPLLQVSLSECLHISPTIVAQENDHEFVITLETQVIRLAASTSEQMLEWMDTLRNKLRELGVLEPKDNLYSREPIISPPVSVSSFIVETASIASQSREDISYLSSRDPNSPLPPIPGNTQLQVNLSDITTSNTTVVYVRNPPTLRNSSRPSSSEIASENSTASASANHESEIPNNAQNIPEQRTTVTQQSEESTLYEPLFCADITSLRQSMGIRNPNYENPPMTHHNSEQLPALPPRSTVDRRRMSSSIISDIQNAHVMPRTHGLGNIASTSDPSLNVSPQNNSHAAEPLLSGSISQSHTQREVRRRRGSQLPLEDGPPPYSGVGTQPRNSQTGSLMANGATHVDEDGRPLSLREVQVLKLQAEILHKSGVRLMLRKKDCVNSIALVECFNFVWVAGWKQKEHPLLHNTFHVGDRIMSIAGHRIQSVQDAHKAIKHQPAIIEFIVRRTPCGRVLAIKREYEGQDLGIVQEGGTAEIKEVKSSGIAFKHGLSVKAPTLDGNSLCNWVMTEINHRPLNLFFKDNEVQDRLNAVGLDMSILVQPLELVKAMKKQLKSLRSYKDYLVQ